DLIALRDQSIDSTSCLLPFIYSRICWAAGLGFLIATVLRLLPTRPTVVRDERTVTVDIAKELGHRPVGDGKYRHVAKIGLNALFRVAFTTLTVAVPGLPAAWDGLTILHLSDLHFYGTPGSEYYDAVVRRCVAAGPPDLLVISGDIIDGPKYLDWIEPVLS